VLLVAVVAFAAVSLIQSRPVPREYVWSLPSGFGMLWISRYLVRTGRVRAASSILCSIGWLIVSADVVTHGPRTLAAGGYLLFVVIGGLTAGPLAAAALGIASIALLAGIELHWVLPYRTFTVPTDAERLTQYATQLTLAAILVAWWSLQMRKLLHKLKASEARRALILDESPDAILSLDLNGVVVFHNRATERMFGCAPFEFVGKKWSELPIGAALEGAKTTGQDPGRDEVRELTRPDGQKIFVEEKTVQLNDEGQKVGSLSILRDVTARRRAEATRASLQDQLVGAQRMEAVGRLAGGMAHDFNNMLTVILGTVEALTRRSPNLDQRALNDIRDAALKGAALTQQLLTFAKQQPSEPRRVDLNRSITDLRPMLGRTLSEDVRIHLELSKISPIVLIDSGQLDQVLVNLSVNARDAMPRGGVLTIATERRTSDTGLLFADVTVSDTGTGIPPETLPRVFEPFFTTKGDRGTGLGLSVVHGVISKARGTIGCESVVGKGTTFRISLPCVEGAGDAKRPVVVAPNRSTKCRRVVLIDDNPRVRQALSFALEQNGVVVDDLDPETSVSEVETRLREADALITDVVMPGVSGPDLVSELLGRGVRKPVVFMSGYVARAVLDRVAHMPKSAILTKPFSVEELLACLHRLDSESSEEPSQSAANVIA
jgi:PAS domain S-box-containing protein